MKDVILESTNFFLYVMNKDIIKTLISNLVHTMRFWNNLHQVRSKSKDWKVK